MREGSSFSKIDEFLVRVEQLSSNNFILIFERLASRFLCVNNIRKRDTAITYILIKLATMSKNKTPSVAVLVDTATGWGRRLTRGIINYSTKHGPWQLSVLPRGRTNHHQLPHGWHGDGIIGRVGNIKMLNELKATGVPVVNISALELSGDPFPRVTMDYNAAAKLAVQHFRERGFQHFAYRGLPNFISSKLHREAFAKAVNDAGFTCDAFMPQKPKRKASEFDHEMKSTIDWLKRLPKPVGIFTWATEVAHTVLDACKVADISVPYEVAVLGGDYDELLCDATTPPLSGMDVPSEQIGHAAAELLDRLMKKKPKSSVKTMNATLIPPISVITKRSTDTIAIEDPDLAQALRYIRDHAFESIQINDILKSVPLSRRSIERKFMEYLGRTPAEEIRRLRLAKAKSLLVDSSLSIEAIAHACGYGTYNYMSYVFMNECDMTPRAYRKQVQAR